MGQKSILTVHLLPAPALMTCFCNSKRYIRQVCEFLVLNQGSFIRCYSLLFCLFALGLTAGWSGLGYQWIGYLLIQENGSKLELTREEMGRFWFCQFRTVKLAFQIIGSAINFYFFSRWNWQF